MSVEILERLAAVETQQTNTNKTLDTLASAMTTMTKEVSELAAALKHPDPAHCTQRDEITALKTEVAALKTKADTATGGGRVLLWLLGGGNLATLSAIIYFLWQFAQHAVK